MRTSISLGRWFGVPVGLHYSWFIIAWLITFSLAARFAELNGEWPRAVVWGLALVTAALFFVSIVLHELAHATVARLGGVPVRGITLFALGGIAQIEKDAATPAREFWMAIAGPITSFVIGVICRSIAAVSGILIPGAAGSAVAAVLDWLAYINIVLALFNLIPGFPLDGGRVLRALVWAATGSADRGTRVAARAGQVVAVFFIVTGVAALLLRAEPGGLWIALIGWFLFEGARAHHLRARVSAALKGLRVGDVMAHGCETVEDTVTIGRFVEEQLRRIPALCFAVTHAQRVVGLIAPDDVERVSRDRWEKTAVAEAMRPLTAVHPVDPNLAADAALELMGRENVDQLPVIANGRLEGIVTRSLLIRQWRLRRQSAA